MGEELVDNFAHSGWPEEVVWRVPVHGSPRRSQRWPAFHPSEVDPDAGYRLHTYTVIFSLEAVLEAALLRIAFVALSARLGWLEIRVNGRAGRAYLGPRPADRALVRRQ